MRVFLFPYEADAILVVNPDAVLTLPISAQRFQAIAGRNQQIGESLRAVERSQPS
jgi:hypothetical protein